jgi:hypothetical protein
MRLSPLAALRRDREQKHTLHFFAFEPVLIHNFDTFYDLKSYNNLIDLKDWLTRFSNIFI